MSSHYAIYALTVGIAENWMRSGIRPCLRSDAGRDQPVPYIIWCLEGSDGVVVVDTAYHPDYVPAQWAQGKDFIEPPKLFAEIGVNIDDVREVIVTHFHIDHFSGFAYFPNATFVIQQKEYDYWTGPLMEYEFLKNLIQPKVRPALEELMQEGRVKLVDGDAELQPGLEVLEAGGHTPGSQMVGVSTAEGKAIICGDIAYTYQNLTERVPVDWYYNLGESVVALERALSTATRPDLAYPNHDPKLTRGKRALRVI